MLFLSQIWAWAAISDIAPPCRNPCPLWFFCMKLVYPWVQSSLGRPVTDPARISVWCRLRHLFLAFSFICPCTHQSFAYMFNTVCQCMELPLRICDPDDSLRGSRFGNRSRAFWLIQRNKDTWAARRAASIWQLSRARDMLFLSQILAWAAISDIAPPCRNPCPLWFSCMKHHIQT